MKIILKTKTNPVAYVGNWGINGKLVKERRFAKRFTLQEVLNCMPENIKNFNLVIEKEKHGKNKNGHRKIK